MPWGSGGGGGQANVTVIARSWPAGGERKASGARLPRPGDTAARRSKKRGKAFYGCENYPKCDFVCWDKPVAETCPECGYVGAESKSSKTRGSYRKCLKCANEWSVNETAEHEVAAVPA